MSEGDSTDAAFEALLQQAAATPSRQVVTPERARFGDRYQVVRLLGEGGMGKVYEVHDRVRDRYVALKTLRHLSGDAVYRFKNEFRALADLHHPHLVTLYGLASEGGDWFITMERVHGVAPAVWLNRQPDRAVALGSLFRQLAAGLAALHARGLVHRDLKPSNVLVTAEGRAKILDFGLVAALDRPAAGDTRSVHLAGTPRYMSPEAQRGDPLTSATDWFAFGVMLRELGGEAFAELADRLTAEAVSARPPPDEVLAALGTAAPTSASAPALPALFIGRQVELQALREAWSQVRRGHSKALLLEGPSGHGKTCLLDAFIAEIADEADVLRGRCYPREFVPFNAFDVVVDGLSSLLRGLDPVACAALLPRNVRQLARMFPVLERVEALEQAPRGAPLSEQSEVLRRGIDAFGELLAGLAERRPLVVVVDDLQWADGDSARLWRAITSGPAQPKLLLVGSARSEEQGAFFEALTTMDIESRREAPETRLELGLMPREDLEALARALGRGDAAVRIAEESSGSPLLATALVRSEGPASLNTLIDRQVADLPADAKRALTTLAMVAGPLPLEILSRAAELESPDATWIALEGASLTRTAAGLIATQHDSVGERLRSSSPPAETRRIFAAVATALDADPRPWPELLARCYAGAGDLERAASHAERAGDRAADGLAWAGAARWYRQALQALRGDGRRDVLIKLGRALTRGAREIDGAIAALDEARALSTGAQADEIAAEAAWLRLRGGNLAGVEAVEAMLAGIGIRLPRSTFGVLAKMLWTRLGMKKAMLAAPGFGPPDPEHCRRFDIIDQSALGLYNWQPSRATLLHLMSMQVALASRDPGRCGHAIRTIAMAVASTGDRPRTMALLDYAEKIDPPEAMDAARRYVRHAHRGTTLVVLMDWVAAQPDLDAAMALEQVHTRPRPTRQVLVRACWMSAMVLAGRFDEVVAPATAWVEEAKRQGDWAAQSRFVATNYGFVAAYTDTVHDFEALLDTLLASELGRRNSSFIPAMCAWSRINAMLYRGAPASEIVEVFERACEATPAQAERLFFVRALRDYYGALVYQLAAACEPDTGFMTKADGYLDRAVSMDVSGSYAKMISRAQAHRALIVGDEAEARSYLEGLATLEGDMANVIGRWVLGWLDGAPLHEVPEDPITRGAVHPMRFAALGLPALFMLESRICPLESVDSPPRAS